MIDKRPLSETRALTEAINYIKRSVRHPGAIPKGTMEDLKEAIIILSELRAQADRGVHVNPRLHRRHRRGRPSQDLRRYGRPHRFRHRGNPVLATLGVNPRGERLPPPLMADWAKIEYHRMDDPDGNQVIREHEFGDGLIAKALPDGSVLLRHPRHALWTKR